MSGANDKIRFGDSVDGCVKRSDGKVEQFGSTPESGSSEKLVSEVLEWKRKKTIAYPSSEK